MLMKLGVIRDNRATESRLFGKRNIYCIETSEGLYVINGNLYKKANYEINKVFDDYLNNKNGWEKVEAKVMDFNDELHGWKQINKETELNVEFVYADNERLLF